jgi:uncharacterized protein (DUF2267 family)
VDYESFISMVQEKVPLPRQETERVACATLGTLERRLSEGEAEDLARLLPAELRSCMTPEREREKFHLDGFLRRVAEATGMERVAAETAALAVLAALRRTVGRKEFGDMRSELPKDLQTFLDRAIAEAPPWTEDEPPSAGMFSYEEFIDRVAAQAGIDPGRARLAAETVLEQLGVKITAGQADDLEPFLPYELRPALMRGIVEGGPGAVRLPLDEFIDRVAERNGVSRDEAISHTRAVFSVLREAVGRKEFDDTLAQLGDDYRMLLKQPAGVRATDGRDSIGFDD